MPVPGLGPALGQAPARVPTGPGLHLRAVSITEARPAPTVSAAGRSRVLRPRGAGRGPSTCPPPPGCLASARCCFSPADCAHWLPPPTRARGGEKKGAPRMSALVPSTPTALPSATHCCHLGGCWRSKPLALACDNGERAGPKAGTARSSFQNRKVRQKGVCISDPVAQTQHPAAGAVPPATQNLGSCTRSTLGPGGRRSPRAPVPSSRGLPSLCRETEWCAQGCPGPGSRRPGSAQPDPPPEGMEPEAPKAASDCRGPGTKGPGWRLETGAGRGKGVRRVWPPGSVSGAKASSGAPKSHQGVLSPPFL